MTMTILDLENKKFGFERHFNLTSPLGIVDPVKICVCIRCVADKYLSYSFENNL